MRQASKKKGLIGGEFKMGLKDILPSEDDLEDGAINGAVFEEIEGNVTPLQEQIFTYCEHQFTKLIQAYSKAKEEEEEFDFQDSPLSNKIRLVFSDNQVTRISVNFHQFSRDMEKGYKSPDSPRDNHLEMDGDFVSKGKINGEHSAVYHRNKIDTIPDSNLVLKNRVTTLFQRADKLLEVE